MCALNRGRRAWPVSPLPADREDRVEADGGAGRALAPSGIAGHRVHRVSARRRGAGGAEGRRAAMRCGQSGPSSVRPLPRHGEAGPSHPRGARLDCQTSASLETAKVASMVAALAPGREIPVRDRRAARSERKRRRPRAGTWPRAERKHFDIDGDQRHGLFSVPAMLFAQPSISGQSRLSPNRPPKAWKSKREGNGH
jgi:hypothetical protein